MKLLKLLFFVGIVFLESGCSSTEEREAISIESSKTPISYSKSELSDLENAEGREIELLNQQKIESLFSEDELIVFHINEVSDSEFFKTLEKIEGDFDNNFKLIHLFLNKKSTQSAVNLFIRKNNLASEAFILSDVELLKTSAQNWEGSTPAIWIKNPKEGIDLMYEQELSEQELITILQPVTL